MKKEEVFNTDEIVLKGVLNLLEKNHYWKGTMTSLGKEIAKGVNRKYLVLLPGSPSALRIVINRIVNRLRNRKVRVKFSRTPDKIRTRYVELISR
jgi:molybdopterin biosynthesis enzyme MoaB